LDDLRIFPRYLGHEMPIYCEPEVERAIRRSFAYVFDPAVQQFPAGGVPKLVFRPIGAGSIGAEGPTATLELLGAMVTPIRLWHGPLPILGFRVGDVAYCTDVKRIPPESMARLQGLEVLILDGLRPEPHVTHLSLGEAVEVARQLRPKRTLFTHIAHRLEHEATNRTLPAGMELAYDGLAISFQVSAISSQPSADG
jgi:phosphoribosyl 1,2-cyclic phosphate phosphodiesterase